MAATVAASERPIEIVGERRRAYDAEFRARLVAASRAPGACVRDLAKRHGVCVSLIYRWRRSAMPRARTLVSGRPHTETPAGEGPVEFVPIGVFGRAQDEGPALVSGPAVGSPAASTCMPPPNTTMPARPGLIEVGLPDGTRLRVDAFVNE